MDNNDVYMKEVQKDLETYKLVLRGELKKLPIGFWDKEWSYRASAIIIKYLIEVILKLDREEMLKIYGANILKQYKLRGMCNKLFDGSVFNVIDNAYPGEFKEWELRCAKVGYWNDTNNVIKAVKWFIEDIHKLDVYKDKREILKEYNVEHLYRHKLGSITKIGIRNSLEIAYPNAFNEDDFRFKKIISDRTGETYNNLKIIEELGGNKVIAKCLICNSEKEYSKHNIVDGLTKDCGCKPIYIIDREGQIFNNLKIIKELGRNKVLVRCLLCGTIKGFKKSSVVSGRIRSCGCLRIVKEGYKTNRIEVLDFMYKGRDGLRYYRCISNTGEELVLSREDIIRLG